LGFVFAFVAVRALPAILPANLPRRQEISPDLSVLLFALAAMTAVALLLGILTAWRSTTGDLQRALTSVSRGFTVGIAGRRLRAYLVVGQIALALVILAGAGLLGRSFLKLLATNPGFDAQKLMTVEFSLPVSREQDTAAQSARTVRQ